MQRPPAVAVRNIAPNNTQITNAQFIKPNQQPILRTQTAAFPLTLNTNSTINPQFMVAKNDQGQMFLVPPTGQSPLVQLQTQTLQTQQQNALQLPGQRPVGQIIKPLNNSVSGQVIVMSTGIATPATTRPILVQMAKEQQTQLVSSSQTHPRLPQLANQRLLPSSASTQQVKTPSLVVLQATQAQQQAVVRPIQIANSSSMATNQSAALPNGIEQRKDSDKEIEKLNAIDQVIHDKEIMANVKKCKNFLSTLLKLAANQPPETNKNVYVLIQGLIDGKVTPEQFTAQLQKELKSSPQPNLIPFLKQSLPYLRQCMLMNKMQIDGIRPPATSSPQTTATPVAALLARSDSSSPLVEQIYSSAFPENVSIQGQSARLQSPQASQSPQQPQLTKQVAANLLNSLVATTSNDGKQIPPVLVTSQQVLRAGIRPNQIQVQVQQHQQPLNRLQLHQLVQQPTPQIVTAMQGAANFITPNQPSVPKFIISPSAATLLQNQAGANGLQNSANSAQGSVNAASLVASPATTQKGEKRKYDAMRDDDDIMDVAAMGGVNLNEETKNILAHTPQLSSGQMRSCKEELFLNTQGLASRVQAICQRKGLTFSPDILGLLCHAARERHASLITQLASTTSHRLQIYKNDTNMVIKNEFRRQLKFRQDLARLEGERAKEQESKAIIKAAKSRTKSDDPEQLKKKELAKKQQQQEMEDKVKEQSNLTALAAIGPRRQKTTSLLGISGVLGSGSTTGGSLLSTSQSLSLRARVKRATLKDMLHVMEGDKCLRNSPLYYKVSYGMIP